VNPSNWCSAGKQVDINAQYSRELGELTAESWRASW